MHGLNACSSAHRAGIPGELAAKDVPEALVVLGVRAAVVDHDVRQHLQARGLQPPHAPAQQHGKHPVTSEEYALSTDALRFDAQ